MKMRDYVRRKGWLVIQREMREEGSLSIIYTLNV